MLALGIILIGLGSFLGGVATGMYLCKRQNIQQKSIHSNLVTGGDLVLGNKYTTTR